MKTCLVNLIIFLMILQIIISLRLRINSCKGLELRNCSDKCGGLEKIQTCERNSEDSICLCESILLS